MRGEPSLEQKSSSEEDATPPSLAMLFTASALRSVTTISWFPRISRRAMLAPILPRPTIPRRMLSSDHQKSVAIERLATARDCGAHRLVPCHTIQGILLAAQCFRHCPP